MKRIISVLLVISTLLLASCSSGDVNSPGQETTAQTATPTTGVTESSENPGDELTDYFASLEKKDYGGEDFVVAAYDVTRFFPADEDGSPEAAAIRERNRKVEEAYNVKLKPAEGLTKNNFYQTLKDRISAGEDYCDVIFAPMSMMWLLVKQNLIGNINSLPFLNSEAPYFDSEGTKSLTIGYKTLGVMGDFTDRASETWCVYFNKDVLAKVEDCNLYSEVMDGNWTLERFKTLADAAKKRKFYGHGTYKYTDDYTKALFAGSGIHYFINNVPWAPAMNLENEEGTQTLIGIIDSLIYAKNTSYYEHTNKMSDDKILESFIDGKMLFFVYNLSAANSIAEKGVNFGILPMPALNAGSGYSSYVGENQYVMMIPFNTSADSEMTGRIISGLAAAGYDPEDTAFRNTVMHYSLSTNEDSVMLRKILENRYYDLAYSLGGAYSAIASASYEPVITSLEKDYNFKKQYGQAVDVFTRLVSYTFNVKAY